MRPTDFWNSGAFVPDLENIIRELAAKARHGDRAAAAELAACYRYILFRRGQRSGSSAESTGINLPSR